MASNDDDAPAPSPPPSSSSTTVGSAANAQAPPSATGGGGGGGGGGGASSSSLDSQIERLKRCEYLRENEVKALCLRAREILVDEGNVQRVDAPVTVRGGTALATARGDG